LVEFFEIKLSSGVDGEDVDVSVPATRFSAVAERGCVRDFVFECDESSIELFAIEELTSYLETV
jgi:hypothetical protein